MEIFRLLIRKEDFWILSWYGKYTYWSIKIDFRNLWHLFAWPQTCRFSLLTKSWTQKTQNLLRKGKRRIQLLAKLLSKLSLCHNITKTCAWSHRGWWTPMFLTAGLASANNFLKHFSRQNTLTQARRNISRHYDLVSFLMPYIHYVSNEHIHSEFVICFMVGYLCRVTSFLLCSWMIPWLIPLQYSRWD